MAPELEDGGRLEVTPAADIYSLGKVIYYMLTGGIVLPRERLHETSYRGVFSRGEQYRLLELLLARMICPVASRIQDMTDVIRELDTIQEWKQRARLVSISDTGFAGIKHLQRQSLNAARVAAEKAEARDKLPAIIESILGWLKVESEKAAALLRNGTIKCEARIPTNEREEHHLAREDGWSDCAYLVGRVELKLQDTADPYRREHTLHIMLCEEILKMPHPYGRGPSIYANAYPALPAGRYDARETFKLMFLPFYVRTTAELFDFSGYLNSAPSVENVRRNGGFLSHWVRKKRPPESVYRPSETSNIFITAISQHLTFDPSEWPGNVDKMRASLSEALDTFITLINQGMNPLERPVRYS